MKTIIFLLILSIILTACSKKETYIIVESNKGTSTMSRLDSTEEYVLGKTSSNMAQKTVSPAVGRTYDFP